MLFAIFTEPSAKTCMHKYNRHTRRLRLGRMSCWNGLVSVWWMGPPACRRGDSDAGGSRIAMDRKTPYRSATSRARSRGFRGSDRWVGVSFESCSRMQNSAPPSGISGVKPADSSPKLDMSSLFRLLPACSCERPDCNLLTSEGGNRANDSLQRCQGRHAIE